MSARPGGPASPHEPRRTSLAARAHGPTGRWTSGPRPPSGRWAERRGTAQRARCYSPALGRRELYEISGHWSHYSEDMFPRWTSAGSKRPAEEVLGRTREVVGAHGTALWDDAVR
ncbi:hypothetical protein ACWD0A_19340 [Streptomyces sp. NPDC002867]